MKTVCEKNMCVGCMACVDLCSKKAITVVDNLYAYNAEIDEDRCISCNACHNICQQNYSIQGKQPIKWFQGWADDIEIRKNASSGGIASALIDYFLNSGEYVAACNFRNGCFSFELFNKKKNIQNVNGSKYIKSNPLGIYNKIKEVIKYHKVLFIGLPCQVAAIKRCFKDNNNLYTVDLICHGTPSPQILSYFLEQHGINIYEIDDIKFREKTHFQLYKSNQHAFRSIEKDGITDNYLISFLNGVCYTENCYKCKYASIERISDITIGDSWGSDLSIEEKRKGISLILCQTNRGIELIQNSNIVLHPVKLDNAIANNKQLSHASYKPKQHDEFFRLITNGMKYDHIIKKMYPKQYYKQRLKKILLILGIIRGGIE